MRVRINNIGAAPDVLRELAIVKYHPNKYYGELENYLKEGNRICFDIPSLYDTIKKYL